MSRKLNTYGLRIGIGGLGLVIGIVIGLGLKWVTHWHVDFSGKIDLGQCLNVLSTVILAIIVTSFLDREKQAELNSKNILIKRVEELYSFIGDTSIKSATERFLYTDATSMIKRININLNSVFVLMADAKLSPDLALRTKIETNIRPLA